MYINYPKHNLIKLRRLLKPFNDEHASLVQRSAGITDISRCEPRYSAILKPLFTEEAIFYEQLSEILKGSLMGKTTFTDTEKHLFSTEKPFTNSSGSSGEENKDSVNEMLGGISSSGYDQYSSALSETSTSMITLEDDFEEQKSCFSTKKGKRGSSRNKLPSGMVSSPRGEVRMPEL